jgi:hypothetical protein
VPIFAFALVKSTLKRGLFLPPLVKVTL